MKIGMWSFNLSISESWGALGAASARNVAVPHAHASIKKKCPDPSKNSN